MSAGSTRPPARAARAARECVALAAIAALAVAPACESETIVLATLPGSGDSGPGPTPVRCAATSECPPGSFCPKAACDAPAGTCTLFPAHCDDDPHPVCGCDHITYFNDCLRQAAGVEAAVDGSCPLGSMPCGGFANAPCPEGAFCARLFGLRDRRCGFEPQGQCWVLPSKCPAQSGSNDRWDACGPPGSPHCVDTCNAVASSLPYRRADMCP